MTQSPLKLLLCSKIQLTVALDAQQQLELRHRKDPLSSYGDGLEIFLEDETPVRVEILDSEHGTIVEVATEDGTPTGSLWEHGEGLYWASLDVAPERKVYVTVRNAAGDDTPMPIFIKVRPESARPWP